MNMELEDVAAGSLVVAVPVPRDRVAEVHDRLEAIVGPRHDPQGTFLVWGAPARTGGEQSLQGRSRAKRSCFAATDPGAAWLAIVAREESQKDDATPRIQPTDVTALAAILDDDPLLPDAFLCLKLGFLPKSPITRKQVFLARFALCDAAHQILGPAPSVPVSVTDLFHDLPDGLEEAQAALQSCRQAMLEAQPSENGRSQVEKMMEVAKRTLPFGVDSANNRAGYLVLARNHHQAMGDWGFFNDSGRHWLIQTWTDHWAGLVQWGGGSSPQRDSLFRYELAMPGLLGQAFPHEANDFVLPLLAREWLGNLLQAFADLEETVASLHGRLQAAREKDLLQLVQGDLQHVLRDFAWTSRQLRSLERRVGPGITRMKNARVQECIHVPSHPNLRRSPHAMVDEIPVVGLAASLESWLQDARDFHRFAQQDVDALQAAASAGLDLTLADRQARSSIVVQRLTWAIVAATLVLVVLTLVLVMESPGVLVPG